MASGHTGNVVPRKGLRVRVSCPPLLKETVDVTRNGFIVVKFLSLFGVATARKKALFFNTSQRRMSFRHH
jgi:hypothetical protein